MNTSDELQAALEGWDGTGDPLTLTQVRTAPGFATLSPNGRMLAINQTQKNWADRLYGEDATGYGDNVRLLETDFDNARRDELKNGLAEDLRSGALTEDQVGQYVKGGAAALDGEAARYVQHRFGDDNEIAGPWRTTKMPLEGADGKPVGYAYLRQAPGDGTGPGNGRVEASWVLNGNDGTQIKGTEDVDSTAELESLRRTKTAIETTRQTAYPPGGQPNDARTPELAAGLKLLDLPPEVQPRAVAHRALTAALQNRPEIVDKIGQGFWAGLPGEASKGFLNLGAATVHGFGGGALFGNRQGLQDWKEGTADIEGSLEGQSRLGFEGGTWNNVLKSVSQEALPMVFSMGAGAAASATRRGLSSAVEKTFLSRMAAIELENAGKAGLAQTAAAELTGEGVGAGAKQALTQSLSRGLFGKWLGTAEIESAIGKQLADRVTNAVAFLPSSARSGLQNMTTTLDAAAEARAAGDEKKAQALEDNAVMNAWAGIGMETLSENIWLNEMLITRGGNTLSKVSNDVLARRLGAGRMAALTERAKQFIQRGAKAGVQEGLEENVAGIGNRAWLNEFAAQNQDLLAGATEEFLGGALLGALMGGAKALAQDGKPAAFNELLQRGLSGDDKAMETLADIRRRAENLPDRPAPAEGVVPDPQAAPAAAAPEGGNGAASTGSPGPASSAGSVTRLPGLTAPQNETTPAPPAPELANAQDAGGANVVPLAAPETAARENPVTPDAAAPGTVENPPVPDTRETVNEQARLAADKESTRRAVLITPGTPMPQRTPGLKAYQGDSPHGTILYNPQKITPAEIRKATQGKVFDASILGMSGQETGPGAAVVTASTPAAANVQAEVVTSPEAVPGAVQAAQQAAPGAVVEVKPAAQVVTERKGPRFAKDAEQYPLVTGLITSGIAPLPPSRHLAKWRQQQKGGLRMTAHDQETLTVSRSAGYDGAPTVAEYKGRPIAQDAIRRMFRQGATLRPDQSFQEALGPDRYQAEADKGTDFWKEVHRELRALDEKPPDEENSVEIRQNAEFYAATANGKIQVNAQELRTGDVLDIEGDRVKVKSVSYDEDGNTLSVELQDGRRFGRQVIDGSEALFVEGYEPRAAPPEGNPDAERLVFSKAPDPFRGDFFAGTDEDVFNLVDELPADKAKREAREKKEREAKEQREAANAKAKAEQAQGLLFRRSPVVTVKGQGALPKPAADAIAILTGVIPEALNDLRIVRSPDELDARAMHPDDWREIQNGEVEAFYDPRSGQSVVILNNIYLKDGETPIGAVARVILHERVAHAGLALLRKGDAAFSKEWAELVRMIPTEELAAMLGRYPDYAENVGLLAEEWFAQRVERARLEKPGTLLRRMWEAVKAAVARIWGRFSKQGPSLELRVRDLIEASRRALLTDANMVNFKGDYSEIIPGDPALQFSKAWPFEKRDWQSAPLPQGIKNRLGARAISAYEVEAQITRAMLTGSPLPREFAQMVATVQDEIRSIQSYGAALGQDLQKAMEAAAKRSGQTALQVADAVNAALTDPAALAAMADPVLQTRTRAVRNFVDGMSAAVAATTGGTMGATIRANAGQWLRRMYAAFDPAANWNAKSLREAAAAGKMIAGRNARDILAAARAYLTTQHPAQTPAGIEAMISDLLDRDQWQQDATGRERADGGKVSREVSSFMRRKEIPAPIRALLGEENNPIKRLAASIGIQAQLIARFDQQQAMRDMGLRMGIFSTVRNETYHVAVGGEDVNGNMRWNGFARQDPATGKMGPVYTTPQMSEALNNAAALDGRDLGNVILRAYKWLGGEAKMNKVALNPDSWAVNVFGNMLGLVQSGDVFSLSGWRNVAEAVRIHRSSGANDSNAVNAVAEALRDNRRTILTQLVASGVAGASYEMRELEAQLDNGVLQFIEGSNTGDRLTGVARGAVIGQAFGAALGPVGRGVGAAAGAIAGGITGGKAISGTQRRLAQAVLSTPDNIGKIAVYLGNYATLRSAGLNHEDAHQQASEKTRNTMPDYSKLPHFMREASKLGLMGSFIAFQYEVYRNYFWSVRYAVQELRSGNGALMMRGMRRLLGLSTVTALGAGVISMIAGAFHGGVDDDKDRAYRRSLGAPWERFAQLAYTRFDKEGASFYNTSYLIPQSTLFELFRAASEGKDFGDGLGNALDAARKQFLGGSVHGDPILEALLNARMSGGKVTAEEGWRAVVDRLDHVLNALEPGAANKLERLRFAITGEAKRGRHFTVAEETLRVAGIRQGTYGHDERVIRGMRAIREAYANAREQARQTWKNDPAQVEAAVARANERITAAEARWREFMGDMKTLEISGSHLDRIRRAANIGQEFYRLRAGKNGPESVPVRR